MRPNESGSSVGPRIKATLAGGYCRSRAQPEEGDRGVRARRRSMPVPVAVELVSVGGVGVTEIGFDGAGGGAEGGFTLGVADFEEIDGVAALG